MSDSQVDGSGASLETTERVPLSSELFVPSFGKVILSEPGQQVVTSGRVDLTEKPVVSSRNLALDFTKGALVLVMVLYHWINYFIGPDWPYYEYLRFLTPSFIFISGFVVSSVYFSRYRIPDGRVSRRLVTRGLKLLALFVCLNASSTWLAPKLIHTAGFSKRLDFANIGAAFTSGNAYSVSGKLVAFYILIPISYFLILAAVLVFPFRRFKYTFHAALALFLICIAALGLLHDKSDNLEFVAIGLMGAVIGFVPLDKINQVIRHPIVLLSIYVVYLVAITEWNVPFSLLVVAAALNVGCIYLIGLSGREEDTLRNIVIRLGKYSLFGYVAQIAILQFLSAGFRRINFGKATYGVSFIAAILLTIAAVEWLDWARNRSKVLDVAYRAVFA